MSFECPNRVSLWLGDLPDRAFFKSYLDDTAYYSSEDYSIPLNRFAAEFGIPRYDHDFSEAHMSDAGPLPIPQLLAGTSYDTSFVPTAVRRAAELGCHTANSFVLLYDFDYSPAPAPREPVSLTFIGAFDYTKTE